jgi:hypothetical protein
MNQQSGYMILTHLIRVGVYLFVLSCAVLVSAEIASAQSGELYIYPSKGQSQAQQDKDRYECHSLTVKQTGFDPSRPAPAAPGTGSSW